LGLTDMIDYVTDSHIIDLVRDEETPFFEQLIYG
jgi:hypothetical protein